MGGVCLCLLLSNKDVSYSGMLLLCKGRGQFCLLPAAYESVLPLVLALLALRGYSEGFSAVLGRRWSFGRLCGRRRQTADWVERIGCKAVWGGRAPGGMSAAGWAMTTGREAARGGKTAADEETPETRLLRRRWLRTRLLKTRGWWRRRRAARWRGMERQRLTTRRAARRRRTG
ncbi:hypothetical protein BC826DRAFT_976092 [Russula brevipes]|nr:hypothetical protein BC826DRAFT_976092 [Russula brevipes]